MTESAIEFSVPEHLKLRKQPKQKRTKALLEKVMASTAILVQEQGYQAVNTNAIAQYAGVDIKSLYEFFPNKEAILYRMADQWLLSLRQMCLQFEQEEYLVMPWREYFDLISETLRKDHSYTDNYRSLQELWVLLPEFDQLDQLHQKFMIQFFIRQFRRFGAATSDKELTALSLFFLALEDGIGATFGDISSEQLEALWQLRCDTIVFHLEKILD